MLQAQPYDVPRWLPAMAAALARRGARDRHREVKTAVQKAFQEFRRTHASDWEREAQRFGREETAALRDLEVAPHYFV